MTGAGRGGPGSGIRLLLILSVIDMLTASLVCGVLLFIVLVGGAGAHHRAQQHFAGDVGPSVIQVEWEGRGAGPTVTVAGPASGSVVSSNSIGIGGIPFPERGRSEDGTASRGALIFNSRVGFQIKTYVVNGVSPAFRVDDVVGPVLVTIHSGSGGVMQVLLVCSVSQGRMTIQFEPSLKLPKPCGLDAGLAGELASKSDWHAATRAVTGSQESIKVGRDTVILVASDEKNAFSRCGWRGVRSRKPTLNGEEIALKPRGDSEVGFPRPSVIGWTQGLTD